MESHPYSDYLNICITFADENMAEGYMTVNKDLTDHIGHVTGGAYTSLADAVGGAAARANGNLYVTQGCSMQFYASTTPEDEALYAKAVIRHRGSRTCIVAVELFHEDGIIAADTCSNSLVSLIYFSIMPFCSLY